MNMGERVAKHKQIIYFISGFLLLGTLASAHSFLELTDTPSNYSTAGKAVVINRSGDGLTFSNNPQSFVLNSFIDRIDKNLDVHVQGDIRILNESQPLNINNNISGVKGTGKIVIAPLAGTDATGTIRVHGTVVDRDTMEEEQGYIDNISINGLCSNTSFTNGGGLVVDRLTDCYITRKWFVNGFNISTDDTTLSSVDVYHASFEQANDKPFFISAADINYFAIHTDAEIFAYFYVINVTNSTQVSIYPYANYTRVGHVANAYYRARAELNLSLNGSEDGYFVEFNFLPNAHQDFENIDFKVWGEYTE